MELKRSVLLPYAVQDMFDLIEQAEHYPSFLPWCIGATILERSDDWVAARIEFSYLKVRFGFETRNRKCRPQWLQVRMVEGPFRNFRSDWTFTPLGQLGCRVDFAMSFELADGRLDSLAGPAAGIVSKAMVEAFVKRAEATLVTLKEFAPAQDTPAAPAHTAVAEPFTPPKEAALINPTTPVLDALRTSPLALHLNAEEAAELATVMQAESVAAHTVLAAEGSSDNHLYVITAGSLSVVKNAGTPEETVLATLVAGDFAHELGFLDGALRYASLVAATDAQVLVLGRDALESLLDRHPRVVYGVMRAIVRVVHRVQTRLAMQAAELTNYIVKQHGRY